MRLFQVLCRYRNTPNGNIYIGKRRIVKPVTFTDMQKLKNQLEIEEQNMFYLRHPYLTSVCKYLRIDFFCICSTLIHKNKYLYIFNTIVIQQFFQSKSAILSNTYNSI